MVVVMVGTTFPSLKHKLHAADGAYTWHRISWLIFVVCIGDIFDGNVRRYLALDSLNEIIISQFTIQQEERSDRVWIRSSTSAVSRARVNG